MALRGFSNFEKMFRAKMAQTTPISVLTAKKKNDGLTQQEVADYKRVFNKVCASHKLINQSNFSTPAENAK